MKKHLRFRFGTLVTALVFVCLRSGYATDLPPGREAEAVIAMARAHLGSEADLRGIRTLQYRGSIESPDQNRSGTLILTLKKPLKQRIEIITAEGVTEITAVNGYEGWTHKRDESAGTEEVRVMNPQNLNRMLVSTWENLNFFLEPKEQHGKTRFIGATEYRGRSAYELHVTYPGGRPYFRRFFDRHSGELIASLTDDGLEFVESGMIRAAGILFPRKVEALRENRRVHVIKFDTVEVNIPIEDGIFEYPVHIQSRKDDAKLNTARQ